MRHFLLVPLLLAGTIGGFAYGFHSLHACRAHEDGPRQAIERPAPARPPAPPPAAQPMAVPQGQTLVIPIIVGVPQGTTVSVPAHAAPARQAPAAR